MRHESECHVAIVGRSGLKSREVFQGEKQPVSHLLYEVRDGVAYLTLNRPEARNAFSPESIGRLIDAWHAINADDNVRAVIITGAGDKAFCAGADLGRLIPLLTGARQPEDEWDHRLAADPVKAMGDVLLRTLPVYKPIIAAINGFALAGGTELIEATDIRIAAETATFGLPEVTRAIIPFGGSLARLPRQIPYAKAMQILLTGDPIDAPEAWRIGLVNEVVSLAELMPRAEAVARRIAENGPLAVRAIKETVLRGLNGGLQDGYRLEDAAYKVVFASEDAVEGPRAFMEKRKPQYKGK